MGEADLEHIADTPEGCAYSVVKAIPAEPPVMDDSLKQYVSQPTLGAMCMITGMGDTPEEARSNLVLCLATELKRLSSAKSTLNPFDQALKDELGTYFAEAGEPCAEPENHGTAVPADAGAVEYGETEETFEHAEDECPPPYGKDAAEAPLEKAPELHSADEFLLSYAASLMEMMRMQHKEKWMYNPVNRKKEPPKIIIASR